MLWVDRLVNLGCVSECCLIFICFVGLLTNRSEGKTSFQSEQLKSTQMALGRTVELVASLGLEGHTILFFTAVLYPVMLPCCRAGLNLSRR